MTEETGPIENRVIAKQMSANTTILCQAKDAPDTERERAILIGNLGDDVLLIGGLSASAFGVGDTVILRMVLGSHLVGFESEIVKKLENPQIYFAKFPLKVEILNLRKAERIQAFFPADVNVTKVPGNDEKFLALKTRILDISAGGCSFRSKTEIPQHSEVTITFALPGERQTQSVQATILDSFRTGTVFTNRGKFIQSGPNIAICQEISQWISENVSFAQE